jgi:solute carrier family 20 (sodium-dependent phosphate transporter)
MLNILAASGAVAFAMAWAIGAQDVSNALGTSVGSKALTVKQAIIVGGVFEFLGSLMGGKVATTISKGVISPDALSDNLDLYVMIMFCTLIGAFMWLAFATYFSLPVSTTHSMIGSLMGLGFAILPHEIVNTKMLKKIAVSWITSPLVGFTIAYTVFSIIHTQILTRPHPNIEAIRKLPFFYAGTFSVLTLFMTSNGPLAIRMTHTNACLAAGVVCMATLLVLRSNIRMTQIGVQSAVSNKKTDDICTTETTDKQSVELQPMSGSKNQIGSLSTPTRSVKARRQVSSHPTGSNGSISRTPTTESAHDRTPMVTPASEHVLLSQRADIVDIEAPNVSIGARSTHMFGKSSLHSSGIHSDNGNRSNAASPNRVRKPISTTNSIHSDNVAEKSVRMNGSDRAHGHAVADSENTDLSVVPAAAPAAIASSSDVASNPAHAIGHTADASKVAQAEMQFSKLMVITACVVAFAHGSNDVSNSIGPFSAIVAIYSSGTSDVSQPVPDWVLFAGGFGIVAGLASYGHKVMGTVGEKITKLTFSRGFAAQIATALTVLSATLLGLSVSTTHCLIGAVTGVGLVEQSTKLNWATIRRIIASWIITMPASAFFSLVAFEIMQIISPVDTEPNLQH